MALSKQAILAHAGVPKTLEVHVPNWADGDGDDTVLVRSMTVREFEVNQANAGKDGDGKASAWVLVRCVLAPDGTRLFADTDVDLIAELSVGDVSIVGDAIMRASGLTEDAKKDAEGNSAAAPSGSSSSDSPPTSSTAPSTN